MATNEGVFSRSFLIFLLVLSSLTVLTGGRSPPNSSTLDTAVNRLSARFDWLREYGLGVGTLERAYRSTRFEYETIEDEVGSSLMEILFSMSSPQLAVDGVLSILNAAISRALSNSLVPPPECDANITDNNGCCYDCETGNSINWYHSFAEITPTSFHISGTEIRVGLLAGELFRFPPDNREYEDPRLTTWYSSVFANHSRQIVIMLDLNTNSNANDLTDTALSLIDSFSPSDRVALIMIGKERQRLCPTSLANASDTQKFTMSRIIRENALGSSDPVNYTMALNSAIDLLSSPITFPPRRQLIVIVDSQSQARTQLPSTLSNPGPITVQVYGQGDFQGMTVLGANVEPLNEIGGHWNLYANNTLSETGLTDLLISSSHFNSFGEQCLSITRAWFIEGKFEGVMTAMLPWRSLLLGLEVATSRRPSSYYFTANREGQFLYYSRFPMTNVVGLNPRDIETSEAFESIQTTLIAGQNESIPFDNTLLYLQPAYNQSYFIRTVPSTYHCLQVLDGIAYMIHEIPSDEIFACLVLADEDESIVQLFNVSSFTSSDNLPIYQTQLSQTTSGQCTDICQPSNDEKLVLQLTTPSTPPTGIDIGALNEYFMDGMDRPNIPEGIAEELSVQSVIREVWLNNENSAIVRRYLTTPSGIFLSYPGINLNRNFLPQQLPSYIPAVTHNTLTLSPAQTDLLNPDLNVTTFSISQALRNGPSRGMNSSVGSVLSVLAADLTMESLEIDVNSSLDGLCDREGYECTVLTDDGYFVLLPPSPPTSPLHISEYENYNGVTLSLLQSGILIKQGCNVIDNFTINHDRFYSFNVSAISTTSCTTTGSGCRDFCIRRITNTSSYLLIAIVKQQCLSNAISFCEVGGKVCSFCDVFSNNIQCPCSCRPPLCSIPSFSLSVCPSKRYVPTNYMPANDDVTTSTGMCSSVTTCTNRTRDMCNSYYCTWCTEDSLCVSKGLCCVSQVDCCDAPNITSLPTCLAETCMAPTTPPTTGPTPRTTNVQAIIIGAALGGTAGLLLLGALILCCVWYQFCRVADDEKDESPRKESAFKAINPTVEMAEKNGKKKNKGEKDGTSL